jgi:hypothetical protein
VGREEKRETFPVPYAGNGSKDSKWWFSVCGLILSWDGRVQVPRNLITLTIR